MLTEADGGPVAVVVRGANVHDSLLLAGRAGGGDRRAAQPGRRAEPSTCAWTRRSTGHLSDATARVYGYEPHVRQIGEEKLDPKSGEKKHPARRWVVERTIAWLNRCRGDPGPLREEGGELPGRRATRLCTALVPAAAPAHDLRWFLSIGSPRGV